jgi:uncharacterized protein (DUF1501 family)
LEAEAMMKRDELTRRDMLMRSAMGLGVIPTLSLSSVQNTLGGLEEASHPLAAKVPHFVPKAKRVIFLYQAGGMSHVDTFDPKEELNAKHGQKVEGRRGRRALKGSDWKGVPCGSNGTKITTLFPHISGVIDDICLIRSMHGDSSAHSNATLQMHTGANGSAMPSVGAWMSYGLGTENTELPAHVVFAGREPYGGSQNWDSYFLPSYHQGVRVTPTDEPIPNVKSFRKPALQARELKMLQQMNDQHLVSRDGMSDLVARMLSFKSAYSMQTLVPQLFNIGGENAETLKMYGIKEGDNTSYAWQCLMARRMAEEGVRFIEIVDSGADDNWDSHTDMNDHIGMAKMIDQPIAALIKDLKQRGMYDDTLIVFCTEFGRTPTGDTGREHHGRVFSCWLAGGAVKGGMVYGASDELGMGVAENGVHVHDFHATILHIMGLDHERLVYRHAGRDFSLTDVHGHVVRDILT